MSTDANGLIRRVSSPLGDCLALDCSTGEVEQWLLHTPDGRLLGRLARPEPRRCRDGWPAWWAIHPDTGAVLRVSPDWHTAAARLTEPRS